MRALHNAERKETLAPQGGKKLGNCGRRVISLLLCLCMTIPMLFSLSDGFSMRALAAGTERKPTEGVSRQADPSTMDTYQSQLDFSDTTRFAGRLWSDKTVFAYDYGSGDRSGLWSGRVLTLNEVLDGVKNEPQIELTDDFLHVYSVLGSTQNVNTENVRPLDVVLLLDISTSMTNGTSGDAMHQVIADANTLINKLMRVDDDPSVHENNRVGVVVYGGGAQVLLPLGHYEKIDGKAFLTVENEYQPSANFDGQSSHFFPRITAEAKNFSAKTSNYMFADSTYLQAALYQGMYMLATSTDTVITENGQKISRQPVLITLTDGATNIVGATSTGTMYQQNRQSIRPNPTNIQFWDPLSWAQGKTYTEDSPAQTVYGTDKHTSAIVPRIKNSLNKNESYGVPNGNPIYIADTQAASLTSVAPRTTAVLLTAGYMKNWIEDHYTTANGGNEVSLTGFGIGLNITPASNNTYREGGLQWAQLYGTMNPREYIIERAAASGGTGELQKVYQTLNEYITSPSGVRRSFSGMEWVSTQLSAIWNFTHPTGDSDSSTNGNKKYDVTSIEDVYYINQFYNATTGTIGDIFDQITEQITTTVFAPVGGMNDLGVGDAVTYMDPIGKYMDVKDVKNLVLFGEMYDIVKTAVYDYQWNETYIEAMETANKPGFTKGVTPLPQGWYKGDPTVDAEFVPQDDRANNGLPPDCSSAADAWNKGWIFRVNFTTAAQFVPTLETIRDPSLALEKERNTEYTFYRIDDTETVRTTLHMNPAYGTDADIPSDVKYNSNQSHLGTPGVYALADLRIWVEDTGDYSDESVGTLTDTNYDEALWVNIPVNMLPLRVVTINENADGTFNYTTNLDPTSTGYAASFPLRVFYTVGISDEVLDDTGRIKIAGALSAEYIEENKAKNTTAATARNVKQGEIEFFSNWYNPLNRYGDYVTTNTDYSYGDPVTSFSPDTSNRYYIFEKALPLYNTAYVWVPTTPDPNPDTLYGSGDGSWRLVRINDKDDGNLDVRTFTPAEFGGNLLVQDLVADKDKLGGNDQDRQDGIWDALGNLTTPIKQVHNGDIILLENHRLTDVTKKDPDPFSSDNYFFLPIEYYELSKTGSVATKTQYVITRKGSEFGSAYKAAGITNGDMLCWHDVSGTYKQDYPYLSYTETGDPSRGKDYIGYPLDSKTGYYEGCDKSQHECPTDPSKKADMSTGTWVVCAKPGGLRVGNLAQNVQSKGGSYSTEDESKQINQYIEERYHNDPAATGLNWGYYANNVTRTANNYYVPTISATSNIEESDVKVNVYLGNNGRLIVMDTTLLVSKMVELPDGITTAGVSEEEFNFQLYIEGLTGTQNAVVVQWMPGDEENPGSWQRQFHYVDLELDSQLFLQATNGTKAVFDEDGCRLVADPSGNYTYATECTGKQLGKHSAGDTFVHDPTDASGEIYYVFIGRNKGTNDLGVATTAFRVYHNKGVDGVESVDEVDVTWKTEGDQGQGSTGTFYATTVWLVSDTIYNTTWAPGPDAEGNSRNLDPANANLEESGKGSYYTNVLKDFELLSINPNVSEETTDLTIQSPYRTISSYWTKEITFGVNSNNDGSGDIGSDLTAAQLYDPIIPSADRPDYFGPDKAGNNNTYIAQHTAEFSLKHGQALLFSGIPSGAVYRVTEKLTDAQMKKGYALKEVRHKQQVGSLSTYRPGAQSLPVYTKADATYGEYGGGTYPQQYANDKTEKGLFWALNRKGISVKDAGIENVVGSNEPFFHTNAMVWEAYSTMGATAQGDNHHQPDSVNVKDGSSIFWLWNGTENINTGEPHTVLDNPSCRLLEDGGCDEVIDDKTVRHYFFKDGVMRDFHYEGEGSGFIRNIGRFITSPTVHFGVKVKEGDTLRDEEQSDAETPAQETKSNTQYTGVYSVFGNTGTFEESANFVNTVSPDLLVITKQMVDMEGNIVDTTPETEFEFTISLTQPGADLAKELEDLSDPGPSVLAQTLYIWKGDKSLKTSGLTWSDGTHKMPDVAPNQTEYQKYILPADATEQVGLEPLALTKSEADGKYTFKVTLKANQAIVLYGLAAGTDYTITETKLNKYPAVDPGNLDDVSDAGLVRTGTIQHDIATYLEMTPSTTPNRADFYNQMFGGKLTVEKRIENTEAVGDDLTTREFKFSVTLTPAEHDELVKEDLTVVKYGVGDTTGTQISSDDWTKVTDEDGNETSSLSMTFTLKHGERVEISGIPLNTSYTVVETGRDGYNLQHVAGNASDAPDTSGSYLDLTVDDGVTGTITEETTQAYLLFVNGKAVAPPFTGGIGANQIMLGGVLLIGLSVALFLYGWRRKRRVI